jgi:hypothetical protein
MTVVHDGRPKTPLYIYLWTIGTPLIVVPAPTGVVYCNQVDGVATQHRALEGFVVPLPSMDARVFRPDWWYRHFNRRAAGDEDAWAQVCREVEAAIASALSGDIVRDLRVLPHPENCEAWIHVAFRLPDLGPEASGSDTLPMEGVLTWENCD